MKRLSLEEVSWVRSHMFKILDLVGESDLRGEMDRVVNEGVKNRTDPNTIYARLCRLLFDQAWADHILTSPSPQNLSVKRNLARQQPTTEVVGLRETDANREP